MKHNDNRKGFTLIEILIIVAIIGIIAAVILVGWATSSQKKAAVGSMKTSINSVATGIEICMSSGGAFQDGSAGDGICLGSSPELVYPTFPSRCGDQPYVCVSGSSNNWSLSTFTDASCSTVWNCKGCRPVCSAGGCQFIGDNPGDC